MYKEAQDLRDSDLKVQRACKKSQQLHATFTMSYAGLKQCASVVPTMGPQESHPKPWTL